MKTRIIVPIHALLWCSLTLIAPRAIAQTARFHTNLGDIDVILNPSVAPKTVANFISYVNKGAYTNTIFHRSVPGFIIQSGGFALSNHTLVSIPQDAAVKNEYSLSNTRGTIAMAKLGSDPNSATNQWFFNEADANASNLNSQNGGFTVFGKVADAASLAIMDKIAAVPVPTPGPLPSPYDQIPLISWNGGAIADGNYVIVLNITLPDLAPVQPAIAGREKTCIGCKRRLAQGRHDARPMPVGFGADQPDPSPVLGTIGIHQRVLRACSRRRGREAA